MNEQLELFNSVSKPVWEVFEEFISECANKIVRAASIEFGSKDLFVQYNADSSTIILSLQTADYSGLQGKCVLKPLFKISPYNCKSFEIHYLDAINDKGGVRQDRYYVVDGWLTLKLKSSPANDRSKEVPQSAQGVQTDDRAV